MGLSHHTSRSESQHHECENDTVNIGLMLGQLRGRWANIELIFDQLLVTHT